MLNLVKSLRLFQICWNSRPGQMQEPTGEIWWTVMIACGPKTFVEAQKARAEAKRQVVVKRQVVAKRLEERNIMNR